jgi:O-methyltransferase
MEAYATIAQWGIAWGIEAGAQSEGGLLVALEAGRRASLGVVKSWLAAVIFALRRLAIRALQTTGLNRVASKLYYNHFHGFKSASPGLDKGFEEIFGHALKSGAFRDGDLYCEFGLFKGYSFWKAQHLVTKFGHRKTLFFGFDSFEGLPEVTGLDVTKNNDFRKGQYACSEGAVRANLAKAGVDWNRTRLFKGFFADSLTADLKSELGGRRIAVAMIDCDLYEATVDVLDWLDDVASDNMILVMDDWNCFGKDDDKGQRRALREFMARKPGWSLQPITAYGLNSQAFILRGPVQA